MFTIPVMKNLPLLVIGLLSSFTALQAAHDYVSEGNVWWSYVKNLANDSMEGRNTGSQAYSRAADYVASEFAQLGLRPAGTKDFFQPMKFKVRQIIEEQSFLELVHDG